MTRELTMPIGGRAVNLPCFFPSISCVKANLRPSESLRFLIAMKYPQFLISAYDIYNSSEEDKKEIYEQLELARKNGLLVLLDSGNYESYWLRDKKWTPGRFHKVLKSHRFDLAFSFDDQSPPNSAKKIIDIVESAVVRDQKASSECTIIPIIHSPKQKLVDASVGVARRFNPFLISIPERILGDGLVERAEKVYQIRKALDATGNPCAIHLLGTGNPLSLLIFSLCGADSFDGLEWFQTTVNYDSALLYHFQQREFFGNQSDFCSAKGLSYLEATLGHNLAFYSEWMASIHDAISSGKTEDLIKEYVPKPFWDSLSKECQAYMKGAKK